MVALIVGIVLVAAGGIWYWKTHKVSTAPAAANNASTTQQSKLAAATSTTYQSADYGISFDYPNTWTVKPGDTAEGDDGLYTKYDPNAVSLITVEMPTDSYPGTGFEGAYFNLSVDKQLDSSQCAALNSQPGPNNTPGGVITIDGVVFNRYAAGSVAAGTSFGTQNYSGYANGVCYEFNLGDVGGSNVNAVTGAPSPSYAGDMSVLEGIFPSVKFDTTTVVAACDQSEAQGQETPNLSGGVAVSQADQDTMLRTLFKMGLINSTSEYESPFELFSPGQAYFIISTSTQQQMYRAAIPDLLNGDTAITPLASISGSSGGEDLWIRGVINGALLYTIVGQSPSVLQAINPQAGQSLWSFSTSSDINNVLISGGGIFVDFFHKYYEPGFVKLDPSTGKILWQSNVGTLPTIWSDGQTVYVIDNSDAASTTLYELSDATGKITAEFPLPSYSNFEGIDECGGNLYLIQTGLTPQNGNGPDNDYTRFNPQTGAMIDVGPVFGPSSSTTSTPSTTPYFDGGPGIQF